MLQITHALSGRMTDGVQLWLYLGFMLTFCSAELLITRPPKNATVLQNTRYLMHCEAAGEPKPRIKWFHDEEEMPRVGINYRIGSTGTLRFRDVKVSDRGTYRCRVESGREVLYSDSVLLIVEVEVEIIQTWPSSGKLMVPELEDVRLTCKAGGIPAPAIQWRKNGISIIEPRLHKVRIDENWEVVDTILVSVLIAENMTETSKFECEAVNQNIGGDTVRSRTFEVIVMPNNGHSGIWLLDTSKSSVGLCVPYNGTICSQSLGSSYVFLNGSQPNAFEHQERIAHELLGQIMKVSATPMLQERCNGHAENLICNHMFPPCEPGYGEMVTPDYSATPTPICRESCKAVSELLCYVQWSNIVYTSSDARLPMCDRLPSKWDSKCTEAKMFDRDETEVTAQCYEARGRWYNGTVNVTRSGRPCQRWELDTPQKHKRKPDVYRELEGAENYCRNPGAEEVSPWCYVDLDVPGLRWELCDIPQCGDKEISARIDEDQPVSWQTIVIITVVSAVGVFVFILVGVLCYHLVISKRKSVKYKNTPQDDLEIDIQKLPANMSYHVVEEPVRMNPKLEAFEYPRNDIIYVKDIGQGAFGRVFKAKAPNLCKKDDGLIAVKMLKEDASDDLQTDFEREASLMAEFDHPNIVKFLGVCAIGKPMCLLFEYMSRGDLNGYLRMCSPEMYINFRKRNLQFIEGEIVTLDITDQLDISRQIAAGMVYLSEKNYVHRDLATRNCLITDNLIVKISDFGLARSVHRLEYYKGSDNDAIPIRWMPLESILYNKFSVESDVWSYGVILWEIFSFALQPYYGMTHEEVVEYLKEGKNLVCPEHTPNQVYELMLKCWSRKPFSRPKFQMLFNAVSALHDELTRKRTKDSTIV
ncbi:muscle, skeletal receptor tyrosine protein kinase-like [Mya arenaria]|uniref:muscle, skeletal receptor tyrosine protein kinase-like n=1 Tax=Mya arenaria TaxID=6604 RepID=UPI0022E1831D|nr:muscle, skeletal receptor tyrosine protein kinase-like [Mya arenaria]